MRRYLSVLSDANEASPLTIYEPKKAVAGRGCSNCPMDKVPGINKVKNLDQVIGKKIMLWAQCPGKDENEKGLELIGRAGVFFWTHARKAGLSREQCDIQNIVRCMTADRNKYGGWETRDPSKEEMHCCSVYNEEAIVRNGGKARVHLILGKIAAKALLKTEFKKDRRTFYSEKLDAWVVATHHPAYFLRGAPRSQLIEFEDAIRFAVFKSNSAQGRFSYIQSQDYKSVPAKDLEAELVIPMRAAVDAGALVSVDIEDDWVEGTNVLVCVGFSWAEGQARIVMLAHQDLKQQPDNFERKMAVIKRVLEDKTIPKVLQHGDYDVNKILSMTGIKVEGYVHDTQYSEYLRYPNRRSYSLESTADLRFREFAGYKSILDPYRDPVTHIPKFYSVPLKILTDYNGADNDLQWRIATDNAPFVNRALLRVYILAAFQLSRMESKAPWYDPQHEAVLKEWIPNKLASMLKELRKSAKSETFNPNAPAQVAAIVYDKLKLDKHLDEDWKEEYPRSTGADTLTLLKLYHPFPGLVMDYRGLAKKESTYVKAFRNSADKNGGRVRTNWHLTGTITGRLRSGGGKDKTRGIVNLQNIAGSAEIENLLVSDLNWRQVESGDYSALDVLWSADQSQLEIRVLAQLSGDPELIRLIKSGEDLHSAVGSAITGIPVEQIANERETRTAIKGIHFGIIYGLNAQSLFNALRIQAAKKNEPFTLTQQRVTELFDNYFKTFPFVKEWLDGQVEFAKDKGYVETVFGFRREISEFGDEERGTYWVNQSRNTGIQSSAHHLILIALAILELRKKTYKHLQRLSMEIHDSLVGYCNVLDLPTVYTQAKQLLEQEVLVYVKKWWPKVEWKVPLAVDVKAGFRLGVLVKYKGGDVSEFVQKWLEENKSVQAKMDSAR